MANRALHYNANVLFGSELGLDPEQAILFAKSNQMVDTATPSWCQGIRDKILPFSTQVRWDKDGKTLLTGSYAWLEEVAVHTFHFGGTRAEPCKLGAGRGQAVRALGVALKHRCTINIIMAGILKHTYDDSATHRLFLGYPSPHNVKMVSVLEKEPDFMANRKTKDSIVKSDLRCLFPPKKVWGHALVPDVDQIWMYRRHMIDIWLAMGMDLQKSTPKSMELLTTTNNDDEIKEKAPMLVGFDIPEYTPLDGTELELFFELAANIMAEHFRS